MLAGRAKIWGLKLVEEIACVLQKCRMRTTYLFLNILAALMGNALRMERSELA